MSPRLGCRQRGAIGLMAAGTLAVALVFMVLAVDSGRLYLEKRKLQSIADTSALETASRGGLCSPTNTANDYARENAARNGFAVVAGDNSRGLTVTCGALPTNASNIRVFTPDATKSEAVRVIATRSVATSIATGIWNMFSATPVPAQTVLSATAVAAYAPPVAQLTIRSSLADLNSANAPLLDATIGSLLGGNISLTAASWQGLASTSVNLLSYLDRLAINLGVQAGDYDALLKTAVSARQLIEAAAQVLPVAGPAATLVVNDVLKVQTIASSAKLLTVGDLLKIAAGTPSAALNTNVQLFQLIETTAQLSSSKNAVKVATQVYVPLLGNVSIQTKVIESPQMSAIGNPEKAVRGLSNSPKTDQIYVRTAQMRTLVTIDAPVLKTVSSVASALTGLVTPVSKVVKGLLNLNLPVAVGGLLCVLACDITDVDITQALAIYIEAGSAEAYVEAFTCVTPATKTLTVKTTTSGATIAIGSVDAAAAFSSSAVVVPQPLRLVDFGSRHCYVAGLLCDPGRTAGVGGGLNLKAQSTIAKQTSSVFYSPVAEMTAIPTYKSPPVSSSVVQSLVDTVNGLQVTYVPPSGSVSSGALASVADSLTLITNTLATAIRGVLSPLLDPLVNVLMKALGITLGNAEVGANLSCHMGRAYLVI